MTELFWNIDKLTSSSFTQLLYSPISFSHSSPYQTPANNPRKIPYPPRKREVTQSPSSHKRPVISSRKNLPPLARISPSSSRVITPRGQDERPPRLKIINDEDSNHPDQVLRSRYSTYLCTREMHRSRGHAGISNGWGGKSTVAGIRIQNHQMLIVSRNELALQVINSYSPTLSLFLLLSSENECCLLIFVVHRHTSTES